MGIWLVKVLLVFLGGLLWITNVPADMTPKEILQRADEARGNLQGVVWKVHIDSIEKGEQQERDLDVKARGYDFLAILTSPPKVRGQKILSIDHNMWVAKPGVKKPVPISPRQKLVGGAAYGDIAATNYSDDYEATSLPDDMVNGEPCHVFDLKAATKKATYDQIKYWVSKDRLVGVKGEYFTVSGKVFKSATFENNNSIRTPEGPRPFVSTMTIADALIKDNITTLSFSEPMLREIPPSTFDLNFLMTR